MEKQRKSSGWSVFTLLVYSVILASTAFSYGVEHNAREHLKKSYSPLYTSRILITRGNDRAIAFTTPNCDSTWARDDGWWFNKYINDPTSTIVVEPMEWPYQDECKK